MGRKGKLTVQALKAKRDRYFSFLEIKEMDKAFRETVRVDAKTRGIRWQTSQ